MEVPLGIVAIVGTAARVTSKTWSLSESWIDAPRDFHRLKDELARVRLFFDKTHQGMIAAANSAGLPPAEDDDDDHDLHQLLGTGADILSRLEQVIDEISEKKGVDNEGELRKRRRMKWMANNARITRLRGELRDVASGICRLLIVRNVSLSANTLATVESLRADMQEMRSLPDTLLSRIEDRFDELEQTVVTALEKPPAVYRRHHGHPRTSPRGYHLSGGQRASVAESASARQVAPASVTCSPATPAISHI